MLQATVLFDTPEKFALVRFEKNHTIRFDILKALINE